MKKFPSAICFFAWIVANASGGSSKSYIYFPSQWCYSGFVKHLPKLEVNSYKNEATFVLNSYSTELAANCSVRTDEKVIFSIQSLGKFIRPVSDCQVN